MPLAVALAFLVCVGPASAHATLEHTTPAANAHLSSQPQQVVLHFDERVNVALGQVTVVGPGGAQLASAHALSDGGKTVTIYLRPGAGDGTYVVSYRIVSLDTHPVSGGFFFRVGHASLRSTSGAASPAAPPTTPTSGSASENTTVRAMYAGCRFAGFVGLLLLVGSAVLLATMWPADVSRRRGLWLAWTGYGLLAAGTMGELVLQEPYAAGVALSGVTGAGFNEVVGTRFGTAHLVRLGLLAVAAPVLVEMTEQHRSRRGGVSVGRPRWPRYFAAPLGAGLLITWAYSGHAGTTDPAISVPSDVVHLAAMSTWIGGLVVLAVAVLPRSPAGALRAMLPRWSRLAMVCVVALVLSGSVQAVLEVGGWSGLARTTYGHLLLAKIGLLAMALSAANVSRRWVRRHYSAPAEAAPPARKRRAPDVPPSRAEVGKLRRSVAVESVFTAAAVGVAAVLIEAAPGPTAQAAPSPPTTTRPITRHGPYRATARRGGVVIHLKVDPAVVGNQYIYLGATRPDGTALHVRQWTLTVSNARLGLHRVNVPVLTDIGAGHRFIYGAFTMPVGGTWLIQVTARTTDIDETVVTRKVRIRS